MKTRHSLPTLAVLMVMLATFLAACSSGDEATETGTTAVSEAPVPSGASRDGGDLAGRDLPLDGYAEVATDDMSDVSLSARGGRAGRSEAVALAAGAVLTPDVAHATGIVDAGGRSIAESEPAPSADVALLSVTSEKIALDGVSGEDLREADESIAEPTEEEIEPEPEPLPRAGQLTAGEWSDLREWGFWESVIRSDDWSRMVDYWGFARGTRISVRVDNGREPLVDAVVTLFDKAGKKHWQTRSDNHGRAELFTGLEQAGALPPYEIVVEHGGKKTTLGSVDPSREQSMSEAPLVARLGSEAVDPKVVDVMFVIDATGSMGDELRYIKAELGSVIGRVEEEFEGEEVKIRVGANVYRDESDDYVVRPHPMTDRVDDVVNFLYRQEAGGGGDTPEAVEVALEDGIEKHEWSAQARARLLFLVLDAPPHYDERRKEKLRHLVRRANELGIRIIAVSSSGVDKETEFLMRFLGIHTGGTYTFLTDHSGIGNSHIAPTIGSYEVEYLDDLLVRLIVQYTDRPESIDAITPRTPEIR